MGLIFVDSCLIIYAFEDHPRHGRQVREALARNVLASPAGAAP